MKLFGVFYGNNILKTFESQEEAIDFKRGLSKEISKLATIMYKKLDGEYPTPQGIWIYEKRYGKGLKC